MNWRPWNFALWRTLLVAHWSCRRPGQQNSTTHEDKRDTQRILDEDWQLQKLSNNTSIGKTVDRIQRGPHMHVPQKDGATQIRKWLDGCPRLRQLFLHFQTSIWAYGRITQQINISATISFWRSLQFTRGRVSMVILATPSYWARAGTRGPNERLVCVKCADGITVHTMARTECFWWKLSRRYNNCHLQYILTVCESVRLWLCSCQQRQMSIPIYL